MKNGTKTMAKLAGVAAAAIISIGGWAFAFGQRTSDKALETRVNSIEIKQARWEERWDERWERILEELRAINARLDKIRN